MKIFFDVLTFLSCAVMLVVLAIEIARFPSKVRQIDLSKNKKNMPVQEYVEHWFFMQELKLVAITLGFFAVAYVGFMCGSVPKNSSFNLTTFVPFVIHFCVFIASVVLLPLYFYYISRSIFRKSSGCSTVIVGVVIGFYANIVIMFTILTVMSFSGQIRLI